MRTSCRFAMAVHVLTVLGYYPHGRLTSALLASSVNTNPVVIRRLLLILQQAGLIETRKGAGFGSCLSRAPSRINLAEVYRAVETEKPFPMPPGKPNAACPVGQSVQTAMEEVFASAKRALERDLSKKTLASILNVVNQAASRSDLK
jgi:DNA-binding IscR family transcriptional regulator